MRGADFADSHRTYTPLTELNVKLPSMIRNGVKRGACDLLQNACFVAYLSLPFSNVDVGAMLPGKGTD
jgi:hypothetical protein